MEPRNAETGLYVVREGYGGGTREVCQRIGHHTLVSLHSNERPILRCDFCGTDFGVSTMEDVGADDTPAEVVQDLEHMALDPKPLRDRVRALVAKKRAERSGGVA
jgi:hypothetical protein